MTRFVPVAACGYLVLGVALLTLNAPVAAAVAISVAREPESQPAALMRTHPHHQHHFTMDDGGKIGALIESRATVAISAQQPQVPGNAVVANVVTPQSPAVGTTANQYTQAQSPAVGQTVANYTPAQSPGVGQAAGNYTEAQAPAIGAPVIQFTEPQAPAIGVPVAQFGETQSPAIGQVVEHHTEAEQPAIGQEAVRQEVHRHNKTYGNFTGAVHYNIKVKGSGHYLRQDAGEDAIIKCVTLPDGDDAYARFRLVAETDGRWRIRNTATHHYMWEYIQDKEVRGTSSLSDAYTSFELEPQADWSFRIKVRGSGNYLHEDVSTGVLAGGERTDNMGSFIMVPLECCEKCEAYFIEPACPPDRCSWIGDSCAGLRQLTYRGAAAQHVLSAAVVAALAVLPGAV